MNGTEPSVGELIELITTVEPHRAASGILEATENDGFRLRVVEGTFSSGTRVHAQRGVPDDARYTISAVIIDPGPPFAIVQTAGQWKRVQQREYVRLRLHAQVWAQLVAPPEADMGNSLSPAELQELSGQVLDVSAGGVQLETLQALTAGDRILLRFDLPAGAGTVETEGLVVRSEASRRSGHLNGIQFVNLPSGQESMIVRFIYEQQLRSRRHSLT